MTIRKSEVVLRLDPLHWGSVKDPVVGEGGGGREFEMESVKKNALRSALGFPHGFRRVELPRISADWSHQLVE